jgi:S1-C subfamily serine protease
MKERFSRAFNRSKTPMGMLASALLGVAIVLGYLHFDPQEGRYTDTDIQRIADQRIAEATPPPPIEPQVFALVRPSVVQITRPLPGETDPTRRGRGIGSGVVVDDAGSILTAYHVIANADNVTVRFFDGTTAQGTVGMRQPEKDLAVIHVRSRLPNGVTPAVLAGGVAQGDKVMAFGSPFGLDGSVSMGIVSALNRSFTVEETGQTLQGMIQFDAAVNPGNSGGPLVDLGGRVVGIVVGLVNPTNERVFIGLGFAMPIESSSGILPPLG